MTGKQQHLSALALDRRALGDLSEGEIREMDLHLSACERCRGRLAAQQESFQKFEQYVLPAILPELQTMRSRSFPWRLAWVVPVVATLALAMLVLPRSGVRPRGTFQDGVAVKGGPNFQTFVRRGTQVFAAFDGVLLLPGDALRFVVQPGGLPYLLIVSRDGAGHLTVYYPFGGTHSAELKSEGRNELPGSVELDNTPGEEKLFALFSKRSLQAARVTAELADSTIEPSAAELGAEALLRLKFVKGTP